MNISGINTVINNNYVYKRKEHRANYNPASCDVFIKNNNNLYTSQSILRLSPSFRSLNERVLYNTIASDIVSLLLNNRLGSSFTIPASSSRTFTELIRSTVQQLRSQSTSLDEYRNSLVRLLDVLNNSSRNGSDVYEPTQLVADAINNSYYEYGNGRTSDARFDEYESLTEELRNQISDIVSAFMRQKDNFRIWNYVRNESGVKRVIANFIPELRKQCTSLEQYKQMTKLFADNVYELYRAIQDNDFDGSFYNLMLKAKEDADNAEDFYNRTLSYGTRGAQSSDTANATTASGTANTASQTASTAGKQALTGKLSMSDVEEVNTFLIDIAKKYNKNNAQPKTKSAITFNPPNRNKSYEDTFLNRSDSANEIFADAVLESRRQEDRDPEALDSTILELMKRRDFNPNYQYSGGYNVDCRPIFILTTLNKPYLLQEILKLRSADPNLFNGTSNDLTALDRAVNNNILDCAYVLLKSGKIDSSEIERCKRRFSMTPEMKGLLNSYPDMDEYITSTFKSLEDLEKINIKTLDDFLRTPDLDYNFIDSNGNNIINAACALKDKAEALRIVSNAAGLKVNINVVNKKGEAPITIALKNKNYDVVAFLINKGADLSVFKDELENTFIHRVISIMDEDDAIKILDLAKEKGIDTDAGNCSGITPFIQAVKLKKYKVIKYLLGSGIVSNKTDKFGRTALHYACILNDPDLLELLLNNFVSTNIRDNSGKLAGEYLKKPELINFYRMFDSMFKPKGI